MTERRQNKKRAQTNRTPGGTRPVRPKRLAPILLIDPIDYLKQKEVKE